ncbi:hypothetical protein GCM10009557_84860 [Virgisporangium ochraceum]
MARTLLVTNDFPPRPGGIQIFVHKLAVRQPADDLVVYASSWRGAREFDAEQPFEVVRDRTSVLLPTPRVARRAADLARHRAASAGPEDFAATMPDGWVREVALAGTPEEVRAGIAARHAAGATSVVLVPVEADRLDALTRLAAALTTPRTPARTGEPDDQR